MKKTILAVTISGLLLSTAGSAFARPMTHSRYNPKDTMPLELPVDKGPFYEHARVHNEVPVDKGPFIEYHRFHNDQPLDKGPFYEEVARYNEVILDEGPQAPYIWQKILQDQDHEF